MLIARWSRRPASSLIGQPSKASPKRSAKMASLPNYRFDLAPYTWQLVREFRGGAHAVTQPPLPIKCAGAPQKALYLSCDEWFRNGILKNTTVEFHNAGGVLFGVKDYVPALMEYIKKYGVALNFNSRLVKIDGPAKTAWFEVTKDDKKETIARQFEYDSRLSAATRTGLCPRQSFSRQGRMDRG